MSDFLVADFGRTFSLGRRTFAPSTQTEEWLAGADGALVAKTLATGERGIRTRAVIFGEAGIYGSLPEVSVDPDGVATFREILPQTGGQKIGSLANPWGDVYSDNFHGDGSSLTGVIHAAGLATTLADYQLLSAKGAANGYASLDSGGKIPSAQMPAISISDTFVVASQVAMLALTAETGDIAVRTDLSKSFILAGTDPSTLGDWQELLTPVDSVLSVFGSTGTITALTVGTGQSLGYSGSGSIAATTLLGKTWASPDAIGTGTPAAATFTDATLGAGNTLAWTGRSKITSTADGYFLFTNNAGTGITRFMIGGSSSSFPAFANAGTLMQVVNAGTGAYTDLSAANLTATASVSAGTSSYMGFAGQAYLKSPSAGILRAAASDASGNGDFQSIQSVLTAGTMTAVSTAQALIRHSVSKFTWTNAQVAALTGTADDITVATLPAKTVVLSARIVVDTSAGTVTTLTGSVGFTGALYTDYISPSDLKAAANTVYTNASYLNSMPSYTGTTAVKMHFISTGGNLSTVTGSTGTVILETMTLP